MRPDLRVPGSGTSATAAALGYVRVGQCATGYWLGHHPLQLAADHGELPGPGARRVAARPLFQLRAGTAGAPGFAAAILSYGHQWCDQPHGARENRLRRVSVWDH